jgi:quercetin dioxygenase-like cupin family protein
MRSLFLVVVLMAGCAPRPASVVLREGAWSVDDLVRSHPIEAGANVRADELARTVASSVHLVQVRGGETPHRHMTHDLTITVLRGEGRLTLEGRSRPLAAGDVVVIPRGVPHSVVRTGGDLYVTLVEFAPPLDAPDTVPVADVDSAQVPR